MESIKGLFLLCLLKLTGSSVVTKGSFALVRLTSVWYGLWPFTQMRCTLARVPF